MSSNAMAVLILLAVALVTIAGGFPAAPRLKGKSVFVRGWLGGSARFAFGITVPFVYFLLSAALSPEWKGAADSPLACLMETKTWLVPLAIWAWVSFYFVVVLRVARVRPWMTLGLFTGFVGSIACASLLAFVRSPNLREFMDPRLLVLLTPLVYLPIWYLGATLRAHDAARARSIQYATAFTAQAAGWVWAAQKSIEAYNALSEAPPCYIVSASTRGYRWLVRPTVRCDGQGGRVVESRQLLRFRAFEALWRERWPESHRSVRAIYNRRGPVIARLIQTPFLASVTFLLLMPCEGLIAAVLAAEALARRRTLAP